MKIFALALGLVALSGTAFAGDRGVVKSDCPNGNCQVAVVAKVRTVRVPVVVAPVVVAPVVVEAKPAKAEPCCKAEAVEAAPVLLVKKVHRPLLRLRAARACDCCN